MHNALLDRLPEDYQGWLIRTDYRIGVQIQLCISDPDLIDSEKTWTALNLLYGRGVPPDLQTALDGLSWFLSGGSDTAPKDEPEGAPPYSFDMDSWRIVSAFKKVFGIDISRERIHWFEFLSMLGDLQGTAFSGVIDIRSTDPSEVDKKRRGEFIRLKNRFALSSGYTAEELDAIKEFDNLLG